MKYEAHITEEIIIDYIRNQVSEETRTELENHIEGCSQCQAKLKEWQELLQSNVQIQPDPSVYLKKRIDKSIDELNKPVTSKSKKPIFSFISGVAIVMLCFGLYYNMRTQDLTYEVVQNGNIENMQQREIVNQPNTNRLAIVPVANNQDIRGNVWVNNRTNEMLVEVEGLTRLSANDYQLWIFHSDNNYNSELLKLENGMARVYYKGGDMTKLKLIKASVEPLGGSEQPTGPETFYVDFNQAEFD